MFLQCVKYDRFKSMIYLFLLLFVSNQGEEADPGGGTVYQGC